MLRLSADSDEYNAFSLRSSGSNTASGNLNDIFGDDDDAPISQLAFQRPVAPGVRPKPAAKPAAAPAQEAVPPSSADGPSLTLFAALVQVFRSADGAWQPVGQAGLALVGGPLPKAFQLVLYEPQTKRPFSITTVTGPLGVPSAQYVSFEDDAKQSWSLHFGALDELSRLLQNVTLVRAFAAAAGAWIVQDVVVGEGHTAQAGDTIGVRQVAWKMPPALQAQASGSPLGERAEAAGDEGKPHKLIVPPPAEPPHSAGYEAGLLGIAKGGIRYVASGGGLASAADRFHQVELLRMKKRSKETVAASAGKEGSAASAGKETAAGGQPVGGAAVGCSSGELPAASASTVATLAATASASADAAAASPATSTATDAALAASHAAAEPEGSPTMLEADAAAAEKAALVSRMARLAGAAGNGSRPGGMCILPNKSSTTTAAAQPPASIATSSSPPSGAPGPQPADGQPHAQPADCCCSTSTAATAGTASEASALVLPAAHSPPAAPSSAAHPAAPQPTSSTSAAAPSPMETSPPAAASAMLAAEPVSRTEPLVRERLLPLPREPFAAEDVAALLRLAREPRAQIVVAFIVS